MTTKMQARSAWEDVTRRIEQVANPSTQLIRSEQAAWDAYMNVCADEEVCSDPYCDTPSPDHVFCEEHRK